MENKAAASEELVAGANLLVDLFGNADEDNSDSGDKRISKKKDGATRRSRTMFTKFQKSTLCIAFERDPFPEHEVRTKLAQNLHLSERQVRVWFQNKRSQVRKGKPQMKEMLSRASYQNGFRGINMNERNIKAEVRNGVKSTDDSNEDVLMTDSPRGGETQQFTEYEPLPKFQIPSISMSTSQKNMENENNDSTERASSCIFQVDCTPPLSPTDPIGSMDESGTCSASTTFSGNYFNVNGNMVQQSINPSGNANLNHFLDAQRKLQLRVYTPTNNMEKLGIHHRGFGSSLIVPPTPRGTPRGLPNMANSTSMNHGDGAINAHPLNNLPMAGLQSSIMPGHIGQTPRSPRPLRSHLGAPYRVYNGSSSISNQGMFMSFPS